VSSPTPSATRPSLERQNGLVTVRLLIWREYDAQMAWMDKESLMLSAIAMMGAVAFCAAQAAETPTARKAPVVGAVRWDAWTAGSEWEKNLSPRQWRDRLPFYGKEIGQDRVEIRADTQAVMDREIAYAKAAGLDYWAYCFSLPNDLDGEREAYGVRLHRASKRKTDVNFCFILMGQGFYGPKEDYPRAVDRLVRYFQDPAYQKVLDGRPLLYIFYVESMPAYFGSDAATRAALDLIHKKSAEAGLKPPYIVADVWSAQTGAEYVDKYGFDAVSAYAWANFQHGNQEYPYATLAQANRDYWEACRATGKKVVPIVSAGWDTRPRWRDPKRYEELYKSKPAGPWYTVATPRELADNLRSAIEWSRQYPESAEANAIILYAWNESDEGGWLVPTKGEGAARLDAISAVLKAARSGR
jgi:hypothetical protein